MYHKRYKKGSQKFRTKLASTDTRVEHKKDSNPKNLNFLV